MKQSVAQDTAATETISCGQTSETMHQEAAVLPVPMAKEYPKFEDFAPTADVTSFEWWLYFASYAWRQ